MGGDKTETCPDQGLVLSEAIQKVTVDVTELVRPFLGEGAGESRSIAAEYPEGNFFYSRFITAKYTSRAMFRFAYLIYNVIRK